MNNTFDWSRFTQVLRYDLRRLWPTFGVTTIVLAALPLTVWLLALAFTRGTGIVDPTFRLGLLILLAPLGAAMLPSRLFRTANLRDEGIGFAMLPASKLEKFLSIALFTFVVAPLAVYVCGVVIDSVLRLLPFGPYHQWLWEASYGFPLFNIMPGGSDEGYHTWLLPATTWASYLGTTALFLFTSTLFRRHKVLFTFLALYGAEFLIAIVCMPILASLLGNEGFRQWVENSFADYSGQQAFNLMMGIAFGVQLALFVLFTALAWRRLKRMPY